MLLDMSDDKRHVVKQILVDHVKTLKKKNNELSNYDNMKVHGDKPRKSKKEISQNFLQEYLNDTSFHGVKYLGKLQIKIGILGKLFWTLIMICSFAFLTWMVWKIWTRYSLNPTRTVIKSFQSPIHMIPFPAVTMCPLIPPLITTRQQLMKRLRLPPIMSNKTAIFLLKYGPAFANEYSPGGKEYVDNMKALLKLNHLSLANFVKDLRPCEDLVESCWWEGNERDCSEMLEVSYTFTGICCSFNYHLEDYIKIGRSEKNSQFIRSLLFGPRSGLTLVLNRNLLFEDDGTGEKYVRFSTNSVGIVVFLHHPLEYVGIISPRQILQAQQELRIGIVPVTTEKLAGYYHRNAAGELVPNCADESTKLKYFPTYYYSNCFTSCSIQAVYQICGCVPFYYTPVAVKHSLRICEWEDFNCLYENANNIRIMENIVRENFTCECQNPCRSISYETRVSSLLLNGINDYNVSPMYKNLTEAQAILKVFMASDSFMEMTTIPIADELYLLASVGGIFSLFMGCSFISAIEIVYYIGLYLRSYFNSKKSK